MFLKLLLKSCIDIFCHLLLVKFTEVVDIIRTSLGVCLNFCIVWIVNSNIYLLPNYFFKYTFQ